MAKKRPTIEMERVFQEVEEKDVELSSELFGSDFKKGLIDIPINRIIPNPNQPRKTFYEQTISELAESIKQHGVLSPIIVRPAGSKYEIIAGERRFRAAGIAGLKEIPAIIKKASDEDAKIISLIENIQREDLNDIDRASALRELKVNLGSPWETIAKRLGLTKRRILDLIGLLALPDEIQDDIRQKKLTEKHGRALRQIVDQEDKLSGVATFIKDNKLTGDQSLKLVRAIKSEPRFTIEESYNTIKAKPPKTTPAKIDPLEAVISEADKLIRTLEEIKPDILKKEDKKNLHSKLLEMQKRIKTLIKTMES